MYFLSHQNVNAMVIGFGDQWLLFLETPAGLWQTGPVHRSVEAARAAARAH